MGFLCVFIWNLNLVIIMIGCSSFKINYLILIKCVGTLYIEKLFDHVNKNVSFACLAAPPYIGQYAIYGTSINTVGGYVTLSPIHLDGTSQTVYDGPVQMFSQDDAFILREGKVALVFLLSEFFCH